MTEATKDYSNLPQAAKPTVFRHEGRRLFVIDGEPRVADEDLASDLELARARNIRTSLIDPNRDKLLLLGSIIQIDPKECSLIRHDADRLVQPLFEKAVAEAVLQLLKAEGLIDPTKRGEKPKINFLNAEQAKFLIVSSATPKGRDLLVDLIKIEKAWKDGTLEPARPAVEPPRAAEALPPPSDPVEPPLAIVFEGVAYELVGDALHVIDESLYRAGGHDPAKMRAIYTDLPAVGPMPAASSLKGASLLSVRHVDFLASAMRRDFERPPSVGFMAVLSVLRAHRQGLLEVFGRTLMDLTDPREVSREYAAGRSGGPKVVGWAPVPFLRDAGRSLRIRHSEFALALGIGERMLLIEVNRYRADLPGEIMERHEREHGIDVIGVYLSEAQASHLGRFMGVDGDALAERLFAEQAELECEIHRRAMEDRARAEARELEESGNPTVARAIVGFTGAVASLSSQNEVVLREMADLRTEMAAFMDRPLLDFFRRSPRAPRKH